MTLSVTSNTANNGSSTTTSSRRRYHQAIFVASYIIFGLLHEFVHVVVARLILPSSSSSLFSRADASTQQQQYEGLIKFLSRAILGRYTLRMDL